MSTTITISTSATPRLISSELNGQSIEKTDITGPTLSAGNTDFVNLIKLLGKIVLRFGGNSVNQTVWSPTMGPTRNGYNQSEANVDRLLGFCEATGCSVIYGLSMAAPHGLAASIAAAVSEAAYVARTLGQNLIAFELGNEPDLYHKNGTRSPSYRYLDFASEFISYADAIVKVVPNAKFVGPDESSEWAYADAQHDTYLHQFVATPSLAKRVSLATLHYYCASGALTDAANLVMEGIQGIGSSTTNPSFYSAQWFTKSMLPQVAKVCAAAGLAWRVDECNAFGNHGTPGMEFSTALIYAHMAFEVAKAGGQGLNWHNCNPAIQTINASGVVSAVLAPFYGMRLVYMVANANGPLMDASGAPVGVYAYAANAQSSYHVALLNMGGVAHTVTLDFPRQLVSAYGVALTAPSLSSTDGIKFGGSEIPVSGQWAPIPTPVHVGPNSKSVDVTVLGGSALFVKASIAQ